MKNLSVILSAFLLFQAVIPCSVEAAKRSKKPWFGGQKNVSAKAPVRKAKSTDLSSLRSKAKKNTVRVTYSGSSKSRNKTGTKIAQQALQYRGSKYRFGGMSTSGFDCSGLVARVWSDLQLKKVPRVSSALYKSGKPVRLAELQEGDLVFFKNTYKRGISHVGVYTGKNKFVHAPGSKKRVSITRLSDPYYQIHYAGARRLY